MLDAGDFDGLEAMAKDRGSMLSLLFTFTYDADLLIRFRSIDALGRVAAVIAQKKGLEHVRDFLRRLFWLTNDESGGLGWMAPEAIAEILVNIPSLFGEYGRLLANLLEEDGCFLESACRAMARLASKEPGLVRENRRRLEHIAVQGNPNERAGALLAMAGADLDVFVQVGEALALPTVEKEINFYDFDTGGLKPWFLASIGSRLVLGAAG